MFWTSAGLPAAAQPGTEVECPSFPSAEKLHKAFVPERFVEIGVFHVNSGLIASVSINARPREFFELSELMLSSDQGKSSRGFDFKLR